MNTYTNRTDILPPGYDALDPYTSVLPEGDIESDPLQLRLDFHSESVLMTRFGDRLHHTQRVSALDVAHALATELDLSTGLLPPDTLWWSKTSGGTRVAVWREPRVWTVRLRTRYDLPAEGFRLPMPGLVFLTTPRANELYVFAAKRRPRRADEKLWKAPTFNVFPSCRVCPGNHQFAPSPQRVPEEFFESYFSAGHDTGDAKSKSHPRDLYAWWKELEGQQHYPLSDLVEAMTVGEAMALGGER